MQLEGKVAMITGSSRGLGKAIAVGMAAEGADIIVAARTETENPQLPGTIYKTAEAIQELGAPRVGPYIFDPAGLARALRVLRRAATLRPFDKLRTLQAQDTAAGCDLLMVDEIGPLELEQGEGFAPILELLPVEGPTHTLIVVRPAFVDQLLLHLRIQSLQVFSVTEENRDKLPLRIVEEFWGE